MSEERRTSVSKIILATWRLRGFTTRVVSIRATEHDSISSIEFVLFFRFGGILEPYSALSVNHQCTCDVLSSCF